MPNDVITRAIDALASGQDLPREQTGAVLSEIMRGDASETQIAAFLIALRTKGETVDELAGLAGTNLKPDAVARCIERAGFGFMFAPAHHAATRYVVPVRKELAVRTIFNFLGPLTNPAGARRQLIGVSDPAFLERMAGALARLGCDRALLVSSEDGLDEMSTSAPTHVVEVNGDAITRYVVSPADVGIDIAPFDAVRGGTPDENAVTTRAILSGEDGAPRDIAVLNAGAAIYAGGLADSLAAGVERAREAIDGGAAAKTLDDYVGMSRELAPA
jgi:anthranilate phosphoribosyltransferase